VPSFTKKIHSLRFFKKWQIFNGRQSWYLLLLRWMMSWGCSNTYHNNNKHNDNLHNVGQLCQCNDVHNYNKMQVSIMRESKMTVSKMMSSISIQHYGSRYNDSQHNCTVHNDIQQYDYLALNIMSVIVTHRRTFLL